MPTDHTKVRQHLQRLMQSRTPQQIEACLMPTERTVTARLGGASRVDAATLDRRWALTRAEAADRAQVLDDASAQTAPAYAANIENYIGTVKVPVGLAGPLRVRGLFAQGDYFVPLATTEAALVASCARGAQLISEVGGCTAAVVNEGVCRAPAFAFTTIAEAGRFVLWITEHIDALREVADATTRFGRLCDVRFTLEGNHVYLVLEYTTGDAAGQNMVTLATDAVCRHILEACPVKPRCWFVEANFSGDKKASVQSFQAVRGRKAVAEVVIPRALVKKRLHCQVEQMLDYYRISSLGGVMSGTIGVQGHYANPLAAVFIACGQDAACVAESAVGITRMEATAGGDLYTAVTLPNLVVGTVGGGTKLPSQQACLRIMGLLGTGHANAFAEVCAALALAGELSIIGALAADHFTRAHQRLARQRKHDDHAKPT